jgi:hypothetical protein
MIDSHRRNIASLGFRSIFEASVRGIQPLTFVLNEPLPWGSLITSLDAGR